jgi:large conductance mechanosensitive channel
MSLAKEFKEFVARGNVIDLAVGVIIGAAFGKIVNSLVTDVIMPPIGLITGRMDFSSLFVSLNGKAYASLADAQKAGAPILAYGNFVNTIIQFLIVAAAVFVLVKVVNRLKREEAAKPAAPPEPPRSEKLLEEIRDALKAK